MDNAANNKRIAKNTALLYIRMLIMMLVSLYTSRVTLQVLGVTDFGIYNVVAGVVFMIGFFQSSLSNAAQRYLSLSIGKNDVQGAEIAFRQSFSILLVFSFLVLVVGETVGLWFVSEKLVVPFERRNAALWVYQFSLISVFFSLIQVTPLADIVSREKMSIYAYLGLFESFVKLGIVYLLLITSADRLIIYGMLMALVSIVTFFIYLFYCFRKFTEAKVEWYWNKTLVGEMSKFIGYNLFGCFAYSGAEQGVSIVLNLFFGPAVNAARGISLQVVHIVTRFTDSLMTAFKPQIIKSYGAGDNAYMLMLIEKSSRFSFFLAAIIAFPIMANMQQILELWLGRVPEYTSSFTILVMIETLIGTLASPLWVVANATGVIKYNQVYGRLITLLALPFSYLSLLILPNPNIAILWLVITQFFYWMYCVYDVKAQVGLELFIYAKKVISPCFFIVSFFCIFSCLPFNTMPYHPIIVLAVSLSANFLFGCIIIFIMLDRKEKLMLHSLITKVWHRLNGETNA